MKKGKAIALKLVGPLMILIGIILCGIVTKNIAWIIFLHVIEFVEIILLLVMVKDITEEESKKCDCGHS